MEAEEAGLIVVEGERIEFVHPLMRSAAYWSAPTGRGRRSMRASPRASRPLRNGPGTWH